MSTTTLLVEILVIGSLSCVWLLLFAFSLVHTPIAFTTGTLELLKAAMPFLLIPGVSMVYAIGWIFNYLAERLFTMLFERRLRDPLFPRGVLEYEIVRALNLQEGSSDQSREYLLNRHILRISRAGVVNFTLIGVAVFVNNALLGSLLASAIFALCLLAAIASFFQWRGRYVSHYKRLARVARSLEPSNHSAA